MDGFLRDIISIMDHVKTSLLARVDNYGASMTAFYNQFCGKVDDFVIQSSDMIRT